jgi:hypothetical protein
MIRMTGTHEAPALAAARAPSDQLPQKIARYIASQEILGSTHVYLTRRDGGSLVLYTKDTWIWEWRPGDYYAGTSSTYRLAREKLNAKRLTFHVPTVDAALDLVDELPNEVRFKRLALMQDEAMPTPPPHPDQSAIDLLAEFDS